MDDLDVGDLWILALAVRLDQSARVGGLVGGFGQTFALEDDATHRFCELESFLDATVQNMTNAASVIIKVVSSSSRKNHRTGSIRDSGHFVVGFFPLDAADLTVEHRVDVVSRVFAVELPALERELK